VYEFFFSSRRRHTRFDCDWSSDVCSSDLRRRLTNAATDLVGHTLGPYTLERLLGQGGFAWAFVGRGPDGTPVAIQVLKPRYAGDAQFESRLRNESETAATLEHPNIIGIRSVAKSGEHVYFAMDPCADSTSASISTPSASRSIRPRPVKCRSAPPTGSSLRACTSRIRRRPSARSAVNCPSDSSAW